MGKILLTILAVGVVVSAGTYGWGQLESLRVAARSSQIVVSTSQVDFGEIDQGNGPVSATIDVRNEGSAPLEIYRVSTSCGCTTATMDQSPIEPGASRPLTIQFDPMVHPDESGPILRVVYLQSSDPRQAEIEVNVIGNVVSSRNL